MYLQRATGLGKRVEKAGPSQVSVVNVAFCGRTEGLTKYDDEGASYRAKFFWATTNHTIIIAG